MDLSGLLTSARSGDNKIRQEAEIIINDLTVKSYEEMLYNLSRELANDNSIKPNRQLAGTIMKNLISKMGQYEGKWLLITKTIRNEIKQLVISSLLSNEILIQRSAANIISGICKIEIPLNEWPDIINSLISNSQGDNMSFRIPSILTLWYIGQEIGDNLNVENIEMILNVLIKTINLETNFELLQVSFNCLICFISFAKKNFTVKEEKKVFFDLIFNQLKNTNQSLRLLSMKCLVEIGKYYYDYIGDDIKNIFDLTILYMEKDDKLVALQGYEFWITLCEEEISRKTDNCEKKVFNYCHHVSVSFSDLIFKHIVTDDEFIEEDESNLSKNAFYLLSYFTQLCDYSLIDKIIVFISNKINDKDSKFRDAAITSFTALLEFPGKDQIYNIITTYISRIIELLSDKSLKVRETASWCIEKICEGYSSYIVQNKKYFELIFNSIFALENSSNKIIVHLLSALHFLVIPLKPKEFQTSNLLSIYLNSSLYILIKLIFNEKSYDTANNVSQAACLTIMSFIENSAPDVKIILQSFCSEVLKSFSNTINNKNAFKSEEQRKNIQAYLVNIIETCLNSGKIPINIEAGSNILNLIIESFKDRNNVYEEGLLACSALVIVMKEEFVQISYLYYPYVLFALRKTDDSSLCKIGITITSDLIQSIGDNLQLNEIAPLILNILTDIYVDKALKISSLNVISDIFIECKTQVFVYFTQIMEVLTNAFNAAKIIPEDKDEELLEYFEALREQTLDSLSCIIHSLKEMNKTNDLTKYVSQIVLFINEINNEAYYPTISIMKASIGIIADLCEIYGINMKTLLNTTLLSGMYKKLNEKAKNKKMKNYLVWCEKAISNVFN